MHGLYMYIRAKVGTFFFNGLKGLFLHAESVVSICILEKKTKSIWTYNRHQRENHAE